MQQPSLLLVISTLVSLIVQSFLAAIVGYFSWSRVFESVRLSLIVYFSLFSV